MFLLMCNCIYDCSRALVVGSLVLPMLALYFQVPMLEFKGLYALTREWWIEVGAV